MEPAKPRPYAFSWICFALTWARHLSWGITANPRDWRLDLLSSLLSNLAALMFCWGGITIAFTSAARRRSVPGAIAGALALTTYLFDYVARVWKPARSIAWLLPFHYCNAVDLLAGAPLPLRDVWVLLGIGICGFVLGYIFYSRRDL